MDIIRRNTDYALRLVANLAGRSGQGPVSSRLLASEEDVSTQLTSKLLQRLSRAGLVRSSMGPQGGFVLAKKPAQISVASVIHTIQGPIIINRCVQKRPDCDRKPSCPISSQLEILQDNVAVFFENLTLQDLLEPAGKKKRKCRRKTKRKVKK